MQKIVAAVKIFAADENAVTAIEYALMAGLLGAGIAVSATALSVELVAAFASLGTMIAGVFS